MDEIRAIARLRCVAEAAADADALPHRSSRLRPSSRTQRPSVSTVSILATDAPAVVAER
jgi:hypothetical protein